MGFEKALRAVKVIKDQIQYMPQNLLNLADGYFSCVKLHSHFCFDELFTRLTMEPFAEKPIDNLASISFCMH